MGEDRVTVWAVRLGTRDEGQRGSLSVSGDAIAFDPDPDEEGHALRIPLRQVRKVKRIHGSPVIVVEHADAAGVRRRTLTAFYFVKPPPLPPRRGEPEPASTEIPDAPLPFSTGMPSQILKRRAARFGGIASLSGWNRIKKRDVKRWRDRLREAAAGARGPR
jgi:hypothetical protein